MPHFLILLRSQDFDPLGNLLSPIRWAPISYTWQQGNVSSNAWWNRYTLTADDDSGLRDTIENLMLCERFLVGGMTQLNPAVVMECDEGEPFSMATKARLFFNHNAQPAQENRAMGLRGDFSGDQFTVLRLAQNRTEGAPTYRAYYRSISDQDIIYQPGESRRRGALGLKIHGPLGAFWYRLHAYLMEQMPGIDSDAIFDRDGNSIGLFPKVGEPLMNVASILNKQKARRQRMSGDEKYFNFLLYVMLEWLMQTLVDYENSWDRFNFHWDTELFPNGKTRGWYYGLDDWLYAPGPRVQHWPKPQWLENMVVFFWQWREFARLMGCVVDAEIGPVQVHTPLVPLHANGQLVADMLLYFFNWEKWLKDNLLAHFQAVEAAKVEKNFQWNFGAVWYDFWPGVEEMLFGLQEKICLLNCVAYLSPEHRQRGQGADRKLLMPPAPFHSDPGIPESQTVPIPAMWETKRVGRGPFLTEENKVAVYLGPWNPTTEPFNDFDVFALAAQALALHFGEGPPHPTLTPDNIIFQLKMLWEIGTPSQKVLIHRELTFLIYLIYLGVDPWPDIPPDDIGV